MSYGPNTLRATYADGTTRTAEFGPWNVDVEGGLVIEGVARSSSGSLVPGTSRVTIPVRSFTTLSLSSPTQITVRLDDGSTQVVEVDTAFASKGSITLLSAWARNAVGAIAGTATVSLPFAQLASLQFLINGGVV